MLVDVKLLTLLCVLKEGSYTAAAEALALSQPAVSYHIHQLEQEFHIKIFYRNPKKAYAYPRGKGAGQVRQAAGQYQRSGTPCAGRG